MFEAQHAMRRRGVDVLAIYHSHPTSDPLPSKTDRERNYSTEVVNFIISMKTGMPVMRGWWLTEEGSSEAEWEIVDK
jgi:proteasome lid subunit RPN8/RPN11